MKFKDEMLLRNSKLNEVIMLSFCKVKVIESNGCEDCIVKLIKDKSYGIECHLYCKQNKNRPFVKFIKEEE